MIVHSESIFPAPAGVLRVALYLATLPSLSLLLGQDPVSGLDSNTLLPAHEMPLAACPTSLK